MLHQRNKTFPDHVLLTFGLETHRVFAALTDDDSVGKGLVVDLDVERPVSAVQSVPLRKVQIVYASHLHEENISYVLNILSIYTWLSNQVYRIFKKIHSTCMTPTFEVAWNSN